MRSRKSFRIRTRIRTKRVPWVRLDQSTIKLAVSRRWIASNSSTDLRARWINFLQNPWLSRTSSRTKFKVSISWNGLITWSRWSIRKRKQGGPRLATLKNSMTNQVISILPRTRQLRTIVYFTQIMFRKSTVIRPNPLIGRLHQRSRHPRTRSRLRRESSWESRAPNRILPSFFRAGEAKTLIRSTLHHHFGSKLRTRSRSVSPMFLIVECMSWKPLPPRRA